jgi:hypothetical protein
MRRLVLVILAMIAGSGPARAQFCPGVSPWVFDDVLASDPFCGYITWMAQNGVSLGCQTIDADHRLYCPNASVSRTQMAAFLNRLVDQPNSTSPTVGTIRKPEGVFLHNYGVSSTFLGVGAGNFTTTGMFNTAVGQVALEHIGSGIENTAVGSGALMQLTSGSNNTAVGSSALPNVVTGSYNTAIGRGSLAANANASYNTALGGQALTYNNVGVQNTAAGAFALFTNAGGINNTSVGFGSLMNMSEGHNNTTLGAQTLQSVVIGYDNVAIGYGALVGATSSNRNVAIGSGAGSALFSGTRNIYVSNPGVFAEEQTMRLGGVDQMRAFFAGVRGVATDLNDAVNVVIDSNGQLGTISSSREAKDGISDMSDASAGLMQLRPVTFHYKTDHDPAGPRLQYGLIAEEVAEVYPGIVATKAGKPETVMYQYLAPMLLNEFQKQQRTIETQAREIAELKRAVEVLMADRASQDRMAAMK